jgi:hypothetical protein
MNRNDNYSNATKYPNIYTCYWGNFSCKNKKPSQDIISNRNRFVEDFKVQKHIVTPWPNISNCFDHKELYLIKDDRENYYYVLLNSPYYIEPSFKKKMEDNGWIKLYKMYSYSADTYYKIIKKTSTRKYKSITKKDTTKLIENLFDDDDIHY